MLSSRNSPSGGWPGSAADGPSPKGMPWSSLLHLLRMPLSADAVAWPAGALIPGTQGEIVSDPPVAGMPELVSVEAFGRVGWCLPSEEAICGGGERRKADEEFKLGETIPLPLSSLLGPCSPASCATLSFC